LSFLIDRRHSARCQQTVLFVLLVYAVVTAGGEPLKEELAGLFELRLRAE